jgi:hypothetical protein
MPALLDHPQVPHEITVHGEIVRVTLTHDELGYLAEGKPSFADGVVSGGGASESEAIESFIDECELVFSFAHESDEPWWKERYLPR